MKNNSEEGYVGFDFQISNRFYGRAHEQAQLKRSFENITTGGCEVALVMGDAGVGKSSLIEKVFRPYQQTDVFFISGNFDKLHQHTPYHGIRRAFGELIRQALNKYEGQFDSLREELVETLGHNAGTIIEAIPEIALLTGELPQAARLGSVETVNHFLLIFERLLRFFCQAKNPLVLFLDDLQWADPASLQLIEALAANQNLDYFFLIGAFRTQEVGPRHPLNNLLEVLKTPGVISCLISMNNLSHQEVSSLLQDTFNRGPDQVADLCSTLIQKTDGNPFAVKWSLQALYRQGLIRRPQASKKKDLHWVWNNDEIQATALWMINRENPQHLSVGLPSISLKTLLVASRFGSRFNLKELADVCEQSPTNTYRALMPALHAELISPIGALESSPGERDGVRPPQVDFRFSHNEIQQAFQRLSAEEETTAIHLRIGRTLFALHQDKPWSPRWFEIVNHLNRAKLLMSRESERLELANLNLSAARHARNIAAFEACRHYLMKGLALVGAFPWRRRNQLTMSFFKLHLEVAFYQDNLNVAIALAEEALANARTPLQKAEIYSLLVVQQVAREAFPEALALGRRGLEVLGCPLPETDIEKVADSELVFLREELNRHPIESLLDLPEMSNPKSLAVIRLLSNLHSPAYTINGALCRLIGIRMVNLSLHHGNAAASIKGYVNFATVPGPAWGDYRMGTDLFRLALKLGQKLNEPQKTCFVFEMGIGCINHWTQPFDQSESLAQTAHQFALATGNFQDAGYILYLKTHNAFARGRQRLPEMLRNWPDYTLLAREHKDEKAIDLLEGLKLLVLDLCEKTERPGVFADGKIKERLFIENRKAIGFYMSVCQYLVFKGQVLYLYGRYMEALEALDEGSRYLHTATGTISIAEHNFYESLVLLALCHDADARRRKDYMDRVTRNQEQMKTWMESRPENFEPKYLLVAAETACLENSFERAADLYDRAVQSAKSNGFNQIEGMANELAGAFYLKRGIRQIAEHYLKEAHHGFLRWGAIRKVHHLMNGYGCIFGEETEHQRTTETTVHSNAPTPRISHEEELAAVFHSAKTISGEMVSARLYRKSMQIFLEITQAKKGVLILQQDDELLIRAVGDKDLGVIAVRVDTPVSDSKIMALSLVGRSFETKQNVFWTKAQQDPAMELDPYLHTNKPAWVCCMPLLFQGRLTGLVYLESMSKTRLLSEQQMDILQILISQVAVSLRNASLYARQERLVAERSDKLRATLSRLEDKHRQLQQAQNQLLHSEKMASLGTLTAGVANGFKLPLVQSRDALQGVESHIKDFKSLLWELTQEDDADPSVWRAIDTRFRPIFQNLETVSNGVNRIDKILSDMRTFSHLDWEEQVRAPILHFLDGAIHRVRPQFVGRVLIETDYEANPTLNCRPVLLNRVFVNLCLNACEAIVDSGTNAETTGRQGLLRVCTRERKGMLYISFIDNGPGIPSEAKNRVFDPFFTTKPVGQGTGLGLSVAFSIVKRHGGNISFRSKVGLGSIFVIKLPLVKDTQSAIWEVTKQAV